MVPAVQWYQLPDVPCCLVPNKNAGCLYGGVLSNALVVPGAAWWCVVPSTASQWCLVPTVQQDCPMPSGARCLLGMPIVWWYVLPGDAWCPIPPGGAWCLVGMPNSQCLVEKPSAWWCLLPNTWCLVLPAAAPRACGAKQCPLTASGRQFPVSFSRCQWSLVQVLGAQQCPQVASDDQCPQIFF